MSGVRLGLGRPRVFQQRVLLALDTSEFLAQLTASRIGDIQQDAAEFSERQQTEPLAIIHGHDFQTGRDLTLVSRAGLEPATL